jgi:hypothetical protein
MRKIHYLLIAIFASCLFSLNVTAQSGNWSSFVEEPPLSGNTYSISKPEHLAWIALQGSEPTKNSFSGKTILLTADIDLEAHWWVPANGGSNDSRLNYPFSGIFDGGYHKIKNLYIKNDLNIRYVGLIRYLATSGIVRNVIVQTGNVNGGSLEAGAIVGFNYGKIEYSVNLGAAVKGGNSVGGIVAANSGSSATVSNSYNKANVEATREAGGIAGLQENGAKISGCFNTGEITSTGSRAGGIVGYMTTASSSVSGSYNTGTTSSNTYSGAIVGELANNGSIIQSFGETKKQNIWIASPWEVVLRDTPPKILKPINLKSAINEYEPFRIIVHNNDAETLEKVNVSVSNLTGENGTIPASNITLYRSYYINISTPSYKSTSPAGYYPDALIPFNQKNPINQLIAAPFSVASAQNAEVWCDLYVPSGTIPGLYTGTVNVFTENENLAEITVNLTVQNFELPKKSTMSSYFGVLTTDAATKMGVLGSVTSPEFKALEKLFHEELIKHRATPSTIQEKYWPALNAAGTDIVDAGHSDVLKDLIENRGFNALTIALRYPNDEPRARVYYDKLEKWLENLGYLDISYVRLKDEPGTAEEYATVRTQGTMIRSGSSKIKRQLTEQPLTDNATWGNLYGSVDIWCPLWSKWEETSANQRLAENETMWSYTALCQGATGTPWWQIDMNPLNFRSPFWLSWHYNITGFLYWTSVNWKALTASAVWRDPYFTTEGGLRFWGEGLLLYPGIPAGIEGFAPSIRLKLYREAMEDYEYMVLAAKKTQKSEIDALVNGVVTNFQTWSKTESDYENARALLSGIILK